MSVIFIQGVPKRRPKNGGWRRRWERALTGPPWDWGKNLGMDNRHICSHGALNKSSEWRVGGKEAVLRESKKRMTSDRGRTFSTLSHDLRFLSTSPLAFYSLFCSHLNLLLCFLTQFSIGVKGTVIHSDVVQNLILWSTLFGYHWQTL